MEADERHEDNVDEAERIKETSIVTINDFASTPRQRCRFRKSLCETPVNNPFEWIGI